jgi:hypothetical protein
VRPVAADLATLGTGGLCAYGYCKSQHRHYWGFKLVLVCAPDGMPIGF